MENPAGPCSVKAMGCLRETLLLYTPVVVTPLPEGKSWHFMWPLLSNLSLHRPPCLLLFYFPALWVGGCLSPLLAKLRNGH